MVHKKVNNTNIYKNFDRCYDLLSFDGFKLSVSVTLKLFVRKKL